MAKFIRDLEAITEQHLANLIEDRVLEGKEIEYKGQLDFKSPKNLETFCKEVVAFANTAGGDLIYGITEKDGVPVSLAGLSDFNADGDLLRLQNYIRVHISPRLFGCIFKIVPLSNGKDSLIVRVPKASGPYMFENKFYIRSGAESRPMDFTEVLHGFQASETVTKKLRNFRFERCAAILAGESPIEMQDEHFIVLHVIPLEAFVQSEVFSIDLLLTHREKLWPMGATGCDAGICLDGVFKYCQERTTKTSSSYSLLMRNGAIESVEGGWIRPRTDQNEREIKIIPDVTVESGIANAIVPKLKILRDLEFEPPFCIFLSLLNVRGFTFWENPLNRSYRGPSAIREEHLHLPETLIYEIEANICTKMKPTFDLIWNACGMRGSQNFNAEGIWQPRS